MAGYLKYDFVLTEAEKQSEVEFEVALLDRGGSSDVFTVSTTFALQLKGIGHENGYARSNRPLSHR
jgi:hypothetical protein